MEITKLYIYWVTANNIIILYTQFFSWCYKAICTSYLTPPDVLQFQSAPSFFYKQLLYKQQGFKKLQIWRPQNLKLSNAVDCRYRRVPFDSNFQYCTIYWPIIFQCNCIAVSHCSLQLYVANMFTDSWSVIECTITSGRRGLPWVRYPVMELWPASVTC